MRDSGRISGARRGTDCPVESINWHEAAAYCNALSSQKRYARCYPCSGTQESVIYNEASSYTEQRIYSCPGYRLPMEAEWCHDWRLYGTLSPTATDPWGVVPEYRMVRGGAWNFSSASLRAVYRDSVKISEREDFVGVRCVRTLP